MTEQQTETRNTEQRQETSDGTQNTERQVYRNQEDFDAAFARKLEKERAKLRQEIKAEAEAEKKKAAMDEAERLKAEMQERDEKATSREKAANQRAIRSEAKVRALEAGVRPERVAAVLRLSDLSEVEVDDDGEPDEKAVKKAVEATLKEYPEFKAGSSVGGGGSNPAGEDGNDPQKNPWSTEHFNLTEQGRIAREDPGKAQRLMKAAQG